MLSRQVFLRAALATVIVGASFTQAGCGRRRVANATLHVTRSASAPMGCPEGALVAQALGGNQWQVQGCGRSATFVCNRGGRGYGWGGRWGGRGGAACQMTSPPVPMGGVQVAAQPQAPGYGVQAQVGYAPPPQPAPQPGYVAAAPPPAPSAQAWSDQIGMTLFSQLQAPVLACVPGTGPLVLNLEIQLNGRIASVSGIETLGPAQQGCVNAVVQQAYVPGGLSQAVRVPFTFR